MEHRSAENWAGLFDTIPEMDCAVKEIEGALPPGLVGTLYRNGPGTRDFAQSYFDGDGLIRALQIRESGDVRFRSRYVETDKYLAEKNSNKPLRRTAGTNLPGGALRNMFRIPAHEANTHVVPFAGRLWALEEGGHPYELDPETLATGPMTDFDGALRTRNAFAAHPHFDPETREAIAFGIAFGPKPAVRTFRVDRQHRLHHTGEFPLKDGGFVHDYALSKRYMAFFIPPLVANARKFLLGTDTFFGSLEWKPELGTRIVLVPRDGGPHIELQTEAFLVGHTMSAWDDGDQLIVDLCHQDEWPAFAKNTANYRTSDWAAFAGGTARRYHIDPIAKRVHHEELTAIPNEFARIHPDRETQRCRYAYCAANTEKNEGGFFRALMKLDRDNGAVDLFDFGSHKVASEPVFVPRPDSLEEDDGWVITFVHDGKRRGTDVAVLDGRKLSDGPIATLRIPGNAGATFHGSWSGA